MILSGLGQEINIFIPLAGRKGYLMNKVGFFFLLHFFAVIILYGTGLAQLVFDNLDSSVVNIWWLLASATFVSFVLTSPLWFYKQGEKDRERQLREEYTLIPKKP
jgi:hypothetical protein